LNRFDSHDQINGSAAVWNGHILFGGCDSRIRIIDTQTGMVTDEMDLMSQMPNSPAIIGNVAYVGDHSGNMYRIQLANGRFARYEIIEHQASDVGSFVAAPAVTVDAVFYYSGRHLFAVNRADGTLRWSQLLRGDVHESSPVVANDRVLVATRSGVLSIFDTNTGELLWEYDTGEQIQGSPAVVEGHFMILTVRGTLLVFGNE
jgi:outer membrane protein assembly factor BamB